MDNEAKLKEFCDLTGVPKKHAEDILKRYNWNTEEAVEAFFAGADDEEDDDMDLDAPAASAPPPKPGASSAPAAKGGKDKASMLDVWDEERKKKGGKDGQYFYVGGENSGEIVIGPDRQKTGDMVKRLFEAAKEHGAEALSQDDEEQEQKPKIKAFVGSGQRLGAGGESSSSSAPPAASAAASSESQSPSKKPPRNYRLRMWENGFSIDDGELRAYTDPENQRLLNAIANGRIPEELLRGAGGAEVHVDLEDRRTEEYTPPARPKVVAFAGHGNRLGSVVPGVTDNQSAAPQPATASASAAAKTAAPAEVQLDVDESQPITTIQIRLADGSRLVTRANHTHTVSQLRDYIRRARPQLARSPFVLMTMFPNRELTDDALTISAAGLLNAAIVQRAGKVA